jgi:hypothetical protein
MTQGLGSCSLIKAALNNFFDYVRVADMIIRIKKARITVERMIKSEYLLFNSPSTNAVVSFCSLTSDKAPPSLSLVKLN